MTTLDKLRDDLRHQLSIPDELDWDYFLHTANRAKVQADEEFITVFQGTNTNLALGIVEEGSSTTDEFNHTTGTTYYCTVVRTYSTNVYTMYVRTGSHVGTLVDTLVVTAAAAYDFRYCYGAQSLDVGTGTIDGFIQNLNLNEASDAFVKIITVAYATVEKINTVSKSTIAKIFNVST